MSLPEHKPQQKAAAAIELEPLVQGETVTAGESPDRPKTPALEPVPPRPVHHCPNCDYNLTGLTSRRCPECGQPFNLLDARAWGFELSEDGEAVRRWERLDWVKRGLGVAMIILGFWCPTIADAVFASGSNVLSTTAKTWLMMFMVAPGDVAFAMVALYLELGWTRTLLTLGVATMVAGLLVALL